MLTKARTITEYMKDLHGAWDMVFFRSEIMPLLWEAESVRDFVFPENWDLAHCICVVGKNVGKRGDTCEQNDGE
jgi:hypothetical protein